MHDSLEYACDFTCTCSNCADYCESLTFNGMMNYDQSPNLMNNYPAGTVATHTCSTGFGFAGENPRTCMNSTDDSGAGSWSGSDLTCESKSL